MSNALPSDVVSACVVASNVATPYLATGRGAPVVVLSTSDELPRALLRDWPRSMRLVVPDLSDTAEWLATAPTFAAWLLDFIDALGLDAIGVVADLHLAGHLAELMIHWPHRIRRVALLGTEQPEALRFDSAADARHLSARALIIEGHPAVPGQATQLQSVIAQLVHDFYLATQPPT